MLVSQIKFKMSGVMLEFIREFQGLGFVADISLLSQRTGLSPNFIHSLIGEARDSFVIVDFNLMNVSKECEETWYYVWCGPEIDGLSEGNWPNAVIRAVLDRLSKLDWLSQHDNNFVSGCKSYFNANGHITIKQQISLRKFLQSALKKEWHGAT